MAENNNNKIDLAHQENGSENNNSTQTSIRPENRLKAATRRIGGAVREILRPIRKYLIIGALIAVAIFVIIIILAAAVWYLKDHDTQQRNDDKTNVPGQAYMVMTADIQEDPETGELTFAYKDPSSNTGSFTNVSGDSNMQLIFDYIASWENGNLLKFKQGRGDYSNRWVKGYITEDGTEYICKTDEGTGNGTRNYGFGVCVYNPKEGGDHILNAEYFEKYGINIRESQYQQLNSSKIAVEIVDNVKAEIIADKVAYVERIMKEHGVTLSMEQIHALVDVTYQAGNAGANLNNFMEMYKAYGNTDNLRSNYSKFRGSNRNNARWKLFHEGIYCFGTNENFTASDYSGTQTTIGSTSGSSSTTTPSQQSNVKTMTDSITIAQNEDGEYCIATKLDARVNEIYRILKSNGSNSLKYFDGGEKTVKEALKLWIMAEYSAQYVNLSSDVENYEYDYDADYIQGIVKVKRYVVNDSGEEEARYITYVPREEFDTLKSNYQSSGDKAVLDHFTIDAQDNLIVAKIDEENQTSSWTSSAGADPTGSLDEAYTTYTVSEVPLNYRDMVKQYKMPFNLLWAFTVYGNDVNFSNEIAKLVIGSNIIIGIRDNVTTTVTTTVDSYVKETHVWTNVSVSMGSHTIGSLGSSNQDYHSYTINTTGDTYSGTGSNVSPHTEAQLKSVDVKYSKTTVNTRINYNVNMNVELIDSWFAKYNIGYTQIENDDTTTDEVNVEESYSDATQEIQEGEEALADTRVSDEVNATIENNKLNIVAKALETALIAHNPFKVAGYTVDEAFIREMAKDIINGTRRDFSDIADENQRKDCEDTYNGYLERNFSAEEIEKLLKSNVTVSATVTTSTSERTGGRTITTTINTVKKEFNKGETEVKEKTDKRPSNGEESFVSILSKKEFLKAYRSLTGSTSSWFFGAIEKNADTEPFVDLLKYLFYKMTGEDYGVKEYEFDSLKNIVTMTPIGGRNFAGISLRYIQAWENSAIYKYLIGEGNGGKYVTQKDGKDYYAVYYGGSNDPTYNLTFGIVISRNYNDKYFEELGVSSSTLRSYTTDRTGVYCIGYRWSEQSLRKNSWRS